MSKRKVEQSPAPTIDPNDYFRVVVTAPPKPSDGPRYRQAANTYRMLDQGVMILLPLLVLIGCLSHVSADSANRIAAISCSALAVILGLKRLSLIPALYESHADSLDAKAAGDDELFRAIKAGRNPSERINGWLESLQILLLLASVVCFTIVVIHAAKA